VPTLLTIQQLSDYLNIKKATLYSWVERQKIPHLKIHGLIRFRPAEIDAWAESFRKAPAALSLPRLKGRGDTIPVDLLIARAKRDVYNSGHGETRPITSLGKEERDGSL